MNLIPLNFITQGEQTPLRRMMLEHALAGGGSLSEYEVTGNPVVFQTNVAQPLSSFTIPFLPVQQGTGDPSPDNVRPISGWTGITAWRTGVNLLDVENTEFGTFDQTTGEPTSGSGQQKRTKYSIAVTPGEKMIYTNKLGYTGRAFYYDANGSYVSTSAMTHNTAVTIPNGAKFMRFVSNSSGYETGGEYMLEAGSTASPYAEYTGESYSVVFPATGKNLLNISESAMTESGWNRRFPLSIKEGTYTISCNGAMGNDKHGRVNLCDEDFVSVKLIVPNYSFGQLTDQGPYTFTLTEGEAERVKYLQIEFISGGTTFADIESAYIQIESGENKTAYEPFTNTVYGGTLDAVNGVLTVEWCGLSARYGDIPVTDVSKGMENKRINTTFPLMSAGTVGSSKAISNIARYTWTAHNDNTPHFFTGFSLSDNVYRVYLYMPVGTSEDLEMLFVCPLATPYEIQLDPITVQTLIGDNTIWTDTNGENTVKYLKKG